MAKVGVDFRILIYDIVTLNKKNININVSSVTSASRYM